jgi:NAD dependent epimerase/dehydratase family enzyme
MGIGSAIGDGKQYMPWIHIDDLCNIYIKALEDVQMAGIYNAVAPDHKTNKEFTREIAHVLNKPFWFPNIPAWIMKLVFGKMSDVLLKGSRVSSEKIQLAGYTFLFTDLRSALNDLIRKSK